MSAVRGLVYACVSAFYYAFGRLYVNQRRARIGATREPHATR